MCVGINLQLPNVDIALFSAVLPNLNNNPSNFVCGFYEHGVNLIESTYFSRYDELIVDFCSYIDKVTQLYFSGFAKTRFYDVLPT